MTKSDLTPTDRLGVAILEVLISKMMLDSTVPDSDDPLENLKRVTLIHVLYDDIVLGLCNVADRSSSSLGAPKLVRRLQREHRNEQRTRRAEHALSELEKYTSQLEPYRNTRVAHLGASPPWGPHPSLVPAIHAAVDLVDALSGAKREYGFADLNLRQVVLHEAG